MIHGNTGDDIRCPKCGSEFVDCTAEVGQWFVDYSGPAESDVFANVCYFTCAECWHDFQWTTAPASCEIAG